MTDPVIAPVVLAAGAGRRFGGDKLTALLAGKPLLQHVLDRLTEARQAGLLSGGVLVHRTDDPATSSLARTAGLLPAANPDPDRGLGLSLRLGLEALGASDADRGTEWALIVLGDQPLLRLDAIGQLRQAVVPGLDLIRPSYAEAPSQPGHPVLVHRRVWIRAVELAGEAGFGSLVRDGTLRAAIVRVAGRNPDVDLPGDLAALEAAGTLPDS